MSDFDTNSSPVCFLLHRNGIFFNEAKWPLMQIEFVIKRCFTTLLERILISLCVILCMQLPFFMTQYTHQLIGHIDELKWQVKHMETSASLSGKSLDQYIAKFRENGDPDFVSQGAMMQSVVSRFEKLSYAWNQLQNSSAFTRPFVFFRYLKLDIFYATFSSFKMGISFTLDSIIFGLVGIVIGSGIQQLAKLFFRRKKMEALRMNPSP